MARLFIGPREIAFINDLNKELIKDLLGSAIYYYPISEFKTQTHDLYHEAVKKVFDNPIKIDAIVDAKFQNITKITTFGVDEQYEIEAFFHYKDLVDKKIDLTMGDFFSYSDIFYEISNINVVKNIFGQAEHKLGFRVQGTKARMDQFNLDKIIGPTDIIYEDEDAVQKKFEQQRGFTSNSEGETGDKRELIENGVLELPEKPREVSEKGAQSDQNKTSTFYDE